MQNFDDAKCDLKSLLQQWKLGHLFNYFMAENIDIEILEMMKLQHIYELLKNFSHGDRIRFECALERYRLSIGNPLQNSSTGPIMFSHRSTTKIEPHVTTKDVTAQTDFPSMILVPAQIIPPPGMASPTRQLPNFSSALPHHSPVTSPPSSTQTAVVQEVYPSPRLFDPAPLSVQESCRTTCDKSFLTKFNARKILEECKPRGQELIKIYESNGCFSKDERIELINIFAHYFYEHSIHLPVKICYELERQILKLFPGERLKDYRSEKRGKIYIRLSNLKHHRRTKSVKTLYPKEQAEQSKWIGNNSATNNELISEMVDSSPSVASPQLTIFLPDIKEECIDEDEEM